MTDDEDLLDRHFNGTADDGDRAALAERLDADRDLRLRFARRVRFEAVLHRACAPASGPGRTATAPVRWSGRWLAAAVLALAAGILAMVVLRPRVDAPTAGAPALSVHAAAPALRLESGRLADVDGRSIAQVSPGSTLMVLGEEDAVVSLAGGSSVRLASASQAVFHPGDAGRSGAIELHRGHGAFTASGGPERMEVITPIARLSAKSARFTVELPGHPGYRTAEVAVESGEVDVDMAGSRIRLAGGEHRQFVDPDQTRPNCQRDGSCVGTADGHLLLRPGRGDDGQLESHALAAGAVITVDGQPAALSAIPPGARLRFVTDAEDRIVRVAASGLVVHARVDDIDDDQRVLALLSLRGRQSLELPLAPQAVVTIDGAAAGLGAVRIGDRVRAQLAIDGSTIITLSVSRRSGDRERHERRDDDQGREQRPAPATGF